MVTLTFERCEEGMSGETVKADLEAEEEDGTDHPDFCPNVTPSRQRVHQAHALTVKESSRDRARLPILNITMKRHSLSQNS